MRTKTDDYCSRCGHKETCREVYGKLGRHEGPNVTWGVIVAFLLPIVVFIASSAAFQWLLKDSIGEKTLLITSVAGATGVTLAVIAGTRFLKHRLFKRHCDTR